MDKLRGLKDKIKSKLTRKDGDDENKPGTPEAKHHPHEPDKAMQPHEAKEPSEAQDPASLEPSLWDEAYDSLKADSEHGKLVLKYEKVLKTKYAPEASKSDLVDDDSGIDPGVRDAIMRQVATGNMERARLLKRAIEAGQKRTKTADKVVGYYRVFFDYTTMYQPIVDAGLKNVSEAALPLAVFTSALQLLARPAKLKNSNASGIKEVTWRLEWYLSIADHMLGNRSLVSLPDLKEPRAELKKRILSLYKAVLMYQMKSVCSYYRSQGWEFLRGFVSLDSWDGDLSDVTKAEAELQQDANRLAQFETHKFLEKIVIGTDAANNILLQIDQDKKDRECLQDLCVVPPSDQMTSILDRREAMINGVSEWILATNEFQHFSKRSGQSPNDRLLWIKGHAGSGKTMLLVRMIRELQRRCMEPEPEDPTSPDVIFYFFEGADNTVNKASTALKSIIWMLIQQQPRLIIHFREDHRAAGSKLFTNPYSFEGLSRKLRDMLQDDELEDVVIALDALDECDDTEKSGRTALVNLIVETLSLTPKVSWLLSSRPLHDLDIEVASTPSQHHQSISPPTGCSTIELDSDSDRIGAAVEFYIDHTIGNLRQLKLKVKDWEEQHFIKILQALKAPATKTFLWVWLVVKELKKADAFEIDDILQEMPSELSETYGRILERVCALKRNNPKFCKNVLAAVALTFRPVAICELSALADLPPDVPIEKILSKCGSFVLVRADMVYTIHQSAQDFLIDKYTEIDDKPVSEAHLAMSRRCLSRLSGANGLKHNIRRLPNLGTGVGEVETPNPDPPFPITYSHSRDYGFKPKEMSPPEPDPLAPIQYSCIFWANHLCVAGNECSERQKELTDDGQVHKFLREHFLHWLESLSLLGKLSDGMQFIRRLLDVVQQQPVGSHQLLELLNDAEKFVFSHGSIIEQAPLQAYGSALVFSPTTSKVREIYWEERPPEIHKIAGIRGYWEAYRQTLEGHTSSVNAVAFSPDGKTLASASHDKTVRLWDATTGAARQTLKGHTSWVGAVAFSPDGKTLASASYDITVRLWDATTGAARQTLEGHTSWVSAVAFSPDGKTLASASYDNTVRLWDATTGSARQTLVVGRTLVTLSFDIVGSYLSTDIGVIPLNRPSTPNPTPTAVLPQKPSYTNCSISPDGEWITRDSEKLLWLPQEYRPDCSALAQGGSKMVFGCRTGRVLLFEFSM